MMRREDIERIDDLAEHIDELLSGEETNICLNALCAVLAGQCAMHVSAGAVTKQRFISDIVECIDVWQDHFAKQISEEQ
jgi:hypothetical protein